MKDFSDIMASLKGLTVPELFALNRAVLDQLRSENIIRDGNSIVSGLAETLSCAALDLQPESQSNYGYDAICKDGVRYQIKARKLTYPNGSRQLGALRGLDNDKPPFDQLIAILFNDNHEPIKAAMLPVNVVRERSRYQAHTNSRILILHDSIWKHPSVRDVTLEIRAAAAKLGSPRS